jgi:DNA-binding transcriptional LysR family regulator
MAAPLVSRLRWKHLELFRRVMEQRTLRGAAQAMHMTQPAATKLVQELEAILGVELFQRSKAGMSPTLYGEVLGRHVNVILADFARLEEEISAVSRGAQGTVRLGVLPSLAPGLLTRAVALMLEANAQVRVTVKEGSTDELLASLGRNELDLAFARVIDRATAAAFRFELVYDEPFAIVCRGGHPLARRKATTYQVLAKARWVLPAEGTPMRALVDQIFLANGALRPAASVECTTLEKIRDMVAGTDMIGVMPTSFVLEAVERRQLVFLKRKLPAYAPMSLAFRTQGETAPVVAEFARKVKASASELGLA